MSLPDYNRYFQVQSGSFMHRALNDMEDAGSKTLKQLDTLDTDGHVPFRITMHGTLKAMTVIPKDKLRAIPFIAPKIGEAFREVEPEIFNRKQFFAMVLPVVLNERDDVPAALQTVRKTNDTLSQLEEGIRDLGLDPNVLANLSELRGAPKSGDASKAVLTINGFKVYPEAYKVFADWIIKMPPYIYEHGNDYVPPECQAVDAGRIAEMMSGFAMTDFRHDHAGARQRILGLQKIELADYRK